MIVSRKIDKYKERDEWLSNQDYLFGEDSKYESYMIPVQENSHLEKGIVRIEDLYNYACDNNITDAAYAISSICEANNLDPTNITFSIREENFIENPDYQEIVETFQNEGLNIYVVPLSENDLVSRIGNQALSLFESTGDISYLELFAYNEETKTIWSKGEDGKFYKTVSSPDHPGVSYTKSSDGKWTETKTQYHKLDGEGLLNARNDIINKYYDFSGDETSQDWEKRKTLAAKASQDLANDIGKFIKFDDSYTDEEKQKTIDYHKGQLKNDLESFSRQLERETYPKSWLAKKIAWFRGLYAKFKEKYKNYSTAGPGVLNTLKWIGAKILSIIDVLLRKLQNAVN